MGTGDTALCPLPGGPGWPGRRGPSPYPEDGSAICELADGAEAGPRLSGQGPGIPFAPWKLPAYEEARATVSREVCSNERYLLGYRQFGAPAHCPAWTGVMPENQIVYRGDAKAKVTTGS